MAWGTGDPPNYTTWKISLSPHVSPNSFATKMLILWFLCTFWPFCSNIVPSQVDLIYIWEILVCKGPHTRIQLKISNFHLFMNLKTTTFWVKVPPHPYFHCYHTAYVLFSCAIFITMLLSLIESDTPYSYCTLFLFLL